jgi:hypothetical protein
MTMDRAAQASNNKMKRILSIFSLLFGLCFTSQATDRVTITIVVTNVPAAANTIVVNASTRAWRAAVATPSTEILIGANIGASATNLFRQLASYALSGPVALGFSSSNVITIQGAIGEAMSASSSGTWATITYATNTVTPMYWVRVPISSEPPFPQTNNPSLLAQGLGTYSLSPLEMVAGIVLHSSADTNQLVIGNAVIRPDGLGNATIVQNGTGTPYEANSEADILNLYSAKLNFPQSYAVVTNTWLSTNIFGYIVATGALLHSPTLDNGGGGGLSLTNTTHKGTNYSQGIFGHTRANVTSLANGNNAAIDFGAKVFIKIKAGPTAAFAICGIAGGADGRELILWNATGQNMTISHDSGVDPTAANRIYTPTGADVVTTANGSARLIYDSEDSRWLLISYQQ